MAKLFRVKRRGRYIGSFRIVIKGRELNLRTQDANEAKRRAQLAVKGLWPEAGEVKAADAVRDALEVDVNGGQGGAGGSAAEGGSIPPPATLPQQGQSGSAGGGQAPPSPAPLVPEVLPSQSWTDAAASAAGDGAPAGGTAEMPGATLGGIDLDPLIADAAKMLVEIQLNLQAWSIKRFKNKEAPPLPDSFPLRAPAAMMWEHQLRIWLPKELPIPPWGAAMLLGLSMGAVQLAAAQPIPKEGAGG